MKSVLMALPLVATLFVFSARAERTVGNGGGLAEMRAIYLQQNLATYLKPCLAKPDACGLASVEVETIGKAVAAAATASPTAFKIDHLISEKEVFSVEQKAGGLIRVSPLAIYEKVGSVSLPRSSSEIAGILLAAFWVQAEGVSKSFALERAASITDRFEEISNELTLSSKPLLVIHQQTIRFGGVEELLVLIEDETKSVQVGEKLFANLTCADSSVRPARTDLQNMRVVSAKAHDFTVALDLVNECFGLFAYQTLVVQFSVDAKGETIASSIKTTLTESL